MRLVATLILLAGSTNALAATDPSLTHGVQTLSLAPPAPQLPKGLPLAQRVAGGILFPDASAHALHMYIVEWEHYPEQAQAAMDAQRGVMTTEAAESLALAQAQSTVTTDERMAALERKQLTLPKVGLIGGIGVVIGIITTAWVESKEKKK